MRVRAFQSLTPAPLQGTRAPRIRGGWRTPRRAPPPSSSSGAGRGPARQCRCGGRGTPGRRAAVVPLIGDHLVDDRVSPSVTAATAQIAAAVCRRSWSYRPIGTLTVTPRLHVNRVLRLMREMRAPVLHLGDARVGVVRSRQSVAIQAGQIWSRYPTARAAILMSRPSRDELRRQR